ncbi:MAG: hypothetical protein R2795_02145 [Saprospiraceae bacterium]
MESIRLKREGKPVVSIGNQMIGFTLLQVVYVVVISLLCTHWWGAMSVIIAGLIGVLLLESINYVEHYGLMRERLPNGKYERVLPRHCWRCQLPLRAHYAVRTHAALRPSLHSQQEIPSTGSSG